MILNKWMNRVQRYVVIISIGVITAACTSFTLPSDTRATYFGRFSVTYRHDSKSERNEGHFTLMKRDTGYTLSLASPLGYELAELTTNHSGATLLLANHEHYSADADHIGELSLKMIGVDLPLNDIPAWIDGHPANSSTAQTISADRFIEDQWTTSIDSRFPNQDPKKIRCLHTDVSNSIDLTLILNNPAHRS